MKEVSIEKFKMNYKSDKIFTRWTKRPDITGLYIYHWKLITLIIIIIEDYYLEDDSCNELLVRLAYIKGIITMKI